MNDYYSFLAGKAVEAPQRGLSSIPALNPAMFPYQKDCTEFLLNAGCGAAFLDTGLGKSIIALDWGRVVADHTKKPVLMLAPLAVSHQHVREAHKFGMDARVCQYQDDIGPGVNVTNYERLHHFTPEGLGGIILDESSIIKGFNGKTTNALMKFAEPLPFRLCCTATPAPNDQMELGQHSQFLGAMDSNEMLARWFITDQQHMGKYRIKHHGVKSFWAWVASWARCLSKPSDLGYSDEGFDLPKLNLQRHMVQADITEDAGDMLFRTPDCSATSIHKEKRLTTAARAALIAELVKAEPTESWIVWCDTDYEADALKAVIPEAVEVRGSMPVDKKESALVGFSDGNIRVLITKPSIAGFGLNWQHCARMAFVGLSFSYESFYQAVRRCWRFGQTRQVDVHVAMANTEMNIWNTISRKTFDHNDMKDAMREAMKNAHESRTVKLNYNPTMPASAVMVQGGSVKVLDENHGQNWSLYNADCVLFSQSLPDNCIDLAVYSPPYSSLYVYSESVADMGNVKDDAEFFEQYSYLTNELYRVIRPGRLVACHVKDLVYYQSSSESGCSGLRPFSDQITKAHTDAGFTFHTRITIYRDPVLERSKTNAHGLLWKTFQSDASFCRVGMPEYLMVFRKWAKEGDQDLVKPVLHPKSKVPLERWQDLAGPIWHATEDDFTSGFHLPSIWNDTPPGQGDGYLSATDVLNAKTCRDEKAERHLCPMPMNITKRAIELWTNKGDAVFSPFTGIGSEGVAALDLDRKFIGTELHPNYFNQACSFLELAENNNQLTLLEAA